MRHEMSGLCVHVTTCHRVPLPTLPQFQANEVGLCGPQSSVCDCVVTSVHFSPGYLIAYHQILATHDTIAMWFIKVVLLGALLFQQ